MVAKITVVIKEVDLFAIIGHINQREGNDEINSQIRKRKIEKLNQK